MFISPVCVCVCACLCVCVCVCVCVQSKYRVDPNYLLKQPQVNSKMRAILIDWLIQVHLRFTLLQETLYLTISVIDRYLQVNIIIHESLCCS